MNNDIPMDIADQLRRMKLTEIASDCASAIDSVAQIMVGCSSDCPVRDEPQRHGEVCGSVVTEARSEYVS